MKTTTGLMMCLAFVLSNVRGQIGRLALSPVQKVEQKIGVTDITIVYSRPSKRGRVIFGDLVPYSELWWTGANRNTTIEITEDVIMSPLRKVRIIRKWKILDDIFIFRTSVMPEH